MEYIFLNGEIGWEITPDSLKKEFDKLKGKEVTIYMNSIGGNVWDGIALYDFLKLQQKNGYHLTTVSTGVTASAVTLPFLAGNKDSRKAHNTATFLIHKVWTFGEGTDDDLQKQAEEIKVLNDKVASIYANETDITKEEALEVMKEDKVADTDWLLEKGFISEIIEYEAVATLRKKKRPKNKKSKKDKSMKISKEDKNWLEQMFNKIEKAFTKNQPQNVIVQDANGVEIDFYELENTDEITIGAKANVDGKPADGEYVIPQDDGTSKTYVFVAGELTEIKDNSNDDSQARIEELENENKELKEQLQNALNEFKNFKAEITSKFEMKGGDQVPNPNGNEGYEGKIRNRKLF